jgi:acyl-CoA synthetase (AMP-forming)/AMP-acid ligase II
MICLPNTQALNSDTFRVPHALADDSLALPELYDWHSENSPRHPLFVFEDGPGSIRTIFWPEAVRATHTAAYRVSSVIDNDSSSRGYTPVIAILSATGTSLRNLYPDYHASERWLDTITYFCFMVGVLRAGYAVFPISPRNSPAAIAHLLKQTGAVQLFVSSDPALQGLASTSIQLLQTNEEPHSVQIYEMPIFEDLFPAESAKSSVKQFPPRHFDMEAPALILHSSGK